MNIDENRFTPSTEVQKPGPARRGKSTTTWFALYGFLFVSIALFAYATNVLLGPLRLLMLNPPLFLRINELVIWYSGIPLVIGTALISWDLIRNVTRIRHAKFVRNDPPANRFLTVALTAYNDERSIGGAVRDFRAHPLVRRVIVISNNSTDRTMELAEQSGALVFNETRQGYGACVHRALREALKYEDTELTMLCEGDLTFRAADIDKFLAYIPHADVVNGSRIVEQLQERDTQLSLYMHYGNLFAGKVLEMKHLGTVSLTDVGTTYELCRNSALRETHAAARTADQSGVQRLFSGHGVEGGGANHRMSCRILPARGHEQGRQREQPHRHAAGIADALRNLCGLEGISP